MNILGDGGAAPALAIAPPEPDEDIEAVSTLVVLVADGLTTVVSVGVSGCIPAGEGVEGACAGGGGGAGE